MDCGDDLHCFKVGSDRVSAQNELSANSPDTDLRFAQVSDGGHRSKNSHMQPCGHVPIDEYANRIPNPIGNLSTPR